MASQIVLAGGDLYRLAAETYGDATQWYRIAAANLLTDPLIRGPLTLILPDPATQPANGGILGGNS